MCATAFKRLFLVALDSQGLEDAGLVLAGSKFVFLLLLLATLPVSKRLWWQCFRAAASCSSHKLGSVYSSMLSRQVWILRYKSTPIN